MESIQFGNMTFKEGLNFTVRLGEKWKNQVCIGDFVKLNNGNAIRIDKIHVCKLRDVPQNVLDLEHDEKCRTLEGLEKELWVIYSDEIRTTEILNQPVTCLGFYVFRRIN